MLKETLLNQDQLAKWSGFQRQSDIERWLKKIMYNFLLGSISEALPHLRGHKVSFMENYGNSCF